MRFLSPDGDELLSAEFHIDLTDHERRRHIFNVHGLPISGSGRHEWSVDEQVGNDWNTVSRVPLDVNIEVEIAH